MIDYLSSAQLQCTHATARVTLHQKALGVVVKEVALYDAQVTRETKVGAGLNRTCLAKRATWGKRERVSNALFEGWLAHRRGQNQLTLMYQLSVNAEAKKGKDIHTLMDSLAHAPCSARGSCGDCTGKVREVFLIHVGGTRCVPSSTDNNYEQTGSDHVDC